MHLLFILMTDRFSPPHSTLVSHLFSFPPTHEILSLSLSALNSPNLSSSRALLPTEPSLSLSLCRSPFETLSSIRRRTKDSIYSDSREPPARTEAASLFDDLGWEHAANAAFGWAVDAVLITHRHSNLARPTNTEGKIKENKVVKPAKSYLNFIFLN